MPIRNDQPGTPIDRELRGLRKPPAEINRSPQPLAGTTRTPTNPQRGTVPDARLRGHGGNGGLT